MVENEKKRTKIDHYQTRTHLLKNAAHPSFLHQLAQFDILLFWFMCRQIWASATQCFSPFYFSADHLESKSPVSSTVLGILDHFEEPPKRIKPLAHKTLFLVKTLGLGARGDVTRCHFPRPILWLICLRSIQSADRYAEFFPKPSQKPLYPSAILLYDSAYQKLVISCWMCL